MSKKLIRAFSLILFLLTLSSCSLRVESADSLVRAPKLTGKNQQVQKTLDKFVGENFILKIPIAGDYTSAFVYKDIDSDGTDECIAFYTLKKDDSVHMNILGCKDGEWKSLYDIRGNGSDVYSLSFADVDGDGINEIIVTWNILDSKTNKYISVYGRYSQKDGPVSIMTEMFTFAHMLDCNSDGSDEIFLIVKETNGDSFESYGRLFYFNSLTKSIELKSEIKLDSGVASYTGIAHDFENGICRIYIDGVVSETHMITEVLTLSVKDMILKNAVVNNKPLSALTLRSGKKICCDINKDGYIEIPSFKELPGGLITDRQSKITEKLFLSSWSRYTGEELVTDYFYIENPEFSYNYIISSDQIGEITAVKDLKLNRLRFYQIDANGNIGHMIFYIDAVPASEYKSVEENVLYSDSKYKYKYKITEYGNEYGINEQNLLKHFIKS